MKYIAAALAVIFLCSAFYQHGFKARGAKVLEAYDLGYSACQANFQEFIEEALP